MKILQQNGLHIKDSTTQIAHYNTFHFLRYAHFRSAKYLFTNIQKQKNMLKSTLLFTGASLEDSKDSECEIFKVLFLYEHKHMERF